MEKNRAPYCAAAIRRGLASGFLGLVLLAGCSEEQSPEQLAADQAFAAGRRAWAKGEYTEGRTKLFRALAFDRRLGRAALVAEEQSILGGVYASMAEFDSARIFYSLAMEEYRGLADRNAVRALTIEMAALHRRMGQERAAYTQLEEALRLAKVFGDSAGARQIGFALLPSCRALDNRAMESQIVNDLLNAYRAPGHAADLARLYREVGLSQFARREYDRAVEHFLRALTFANQARDSVVAVESLLRVGMAFEATGKTSEAFQSYSDGLRRADKTRGVIGYRNEMLIRIGNAYLRSRQIEQARRFYNAALTSAIRVGNKLMEGMIVIQLGHCDVETTREAAIKNYLGATDLFRVAGYPPGIAYAQLSLGVALARSNKVTEALQALRASIEALETVQVQPDPGNLYTDCEAAFFGPRSGTAYDEIIDLLLRSGQHSEGFWFAERKRGWEHLRVLGAQEPRTADSALTALIRDYREARYRRIGAENQAARLLSSTFQQKELLSAVRAALEKSGVRLAGKAERVVHSNRLFEPFVRIAGVRPEEVRGRVAPGTAVVEYIPTKRSLYAFVVTSGRVDVQQAAIDRDRLHSAAGELDGYLRLAEAHGDTISKVTVLPDPRAIELLRLMYEAFVRPVEPEIRSNEKLVVVLPPEFATVPVHALRRNNARGTPYLAEQILVSYLPTANLAEPAKTPVVSTRRDVVGIGYQGMTSWDVEYELRDIRAFYKEARLYFGPQATLATLQHEHGDVVHLAVEVRYNDATPWTAAMILSDGKSLSSSAMVLLGECTAFPAFPAVVVSNLSADQALAHIVLAPLLLSNGSGSVIMNAYTPSRKVKKVFGEAFYTSLLGGASAQNAFRNVQVEMIRNPEFSSPLVWGTFFLWGR
jgi:tetratricopeptide (TPR) repeat protein